MDEREWLTSTDPQAMLDFLRDSGKVAERKARLFACACVRRIWSLLPDQACRDAIDTSEQFADGKLGYEELTSAQLAMNLHRKTRPAAREALRSCLHAILVGSAAVRAAWSTDVTGLFEWAWASIALGVQSRRWLRRHRHQVVRFRGRCVMPARPEGLAQANLLRDIFGSPSADHPRSLSCWIPSSPWPTLHTTNGSCRADSSPLRGSPYSRTPGGSRGGGRAGGASP